MPGVSAPAAGPAGLVSDVSQGFGGATNIGPQPPGGAAPSLSPYGGFTDMTGAYGPGSDLGAQLSGGGSGVLGGGGAQPLTPYTDMTGAYGPGPVVAPNRIATPQFGAPGSGTHSGVYDAPTLYDYGRFPATDIGTYGPGNVPSSQLPNYGGSNFADVSGYRGKDVVLGASAGDDLSAMQHMSAYQPNTSTSVTGLTTPAVSQQVGLGERLSNLGKGLPGFMKGDMAKQVGAKLVTQGIAGLLKPDELPMSPMERAAIENQNRLRRIQEDQLRKQQGYADQFMNQAQAINPDVYGRQALVPYQERLARGTAARTRNMTPAQRVAAGRRSALDQARLLGGAFETGQARGQTMRDQYMTAARGAAPDYTRLADSFGQDAANAATYFGRGQQEDKNIAGVFDPLVQAGIFGRSKEELDRINRAADKREKDVD